MSISVQLVKDYFVCPIEERVMEMFIPVPVFKKLLQGAKLLEVCASLSKPTSLVSSEERYKNGIPSASRAVSLICIPLVKVM